MSIVSYAEDRACELVDQVRKVLDLDAYKTVFPHIRIVPVPREYQEALAAVAGCMNENAELLGVLASGISVIDYRRFQAVPAKVEFSAGGRPAVLMLASDVAELDARWGHDFVVDSLIRWQLQGLSPVVPASWTTTCDEWLKLQTPVAQPEGPLPEEDGGPGVVDAVPRA